MDNGGTEIHEVGAAFVFAGGEQSSTSRNDRGAGRSAASLFQAMRTLNWKYHLGLVSLDVELADRTLSLSVSPVHAAIILHFQTKSE